MVEFNIDWKKAENKRLVEGKSLVFHCHHYNCYLQRTIEDAQSIDGKGIQVNTAREVAHEHFTKAFSNHPELNTPQKKFGFASTFFQIAGFGKVDFANMKEDGGIVKCPSSHYARGWVAKWGKRKTPACHFNAGWIAGVAAAVFNKDRYSYDVEEIECEAVKGKGCAYRVGVR